MELASALCLRLDPAAPDVVSFTGGGGKTSSVRRLAAEIVAHGGRVISTTTTRLAAYEVEGDPATVEVAAAGLPLDQIAGALARHHRCVLVRPEIVDGVGRKYPGLSPAQVDDLAAHAGAWGVGAILVEADGSRMLPAKAPADYEPPVPASTTLLVHVIGMDAVGRLIVEGQLHRPQQMRQVLGLDVIARLRLTPAMAARLLVHEQGGGKHRPPGADLVALLNKAESAPARACARLAARALAAAGTCLPDRVHRSAASAAGL